MVPDPEPIPTALRDAILAWYRASGRVLPFRMTRDPYAILVSEVMAQRTRIDRVSEAWTRFLARFPTVRSLADATAADVLRQWRGMGYNRRALNLHRLARVVVADHGGQIPRDVAALARLPGVGPYTARAVAALAFGVPVGAVDTNVRRVLGRVAGMPLEPTGTADAATERAIQALAEGAVAADAPGEWTHALMDVGATFCRPRAPRCVACPAEPWCRFALDGVVAPDSPAALAPSARPLAAPPATAAAAPAPIPFEETSRWLRGRILDRLRDAGPAAWVRIRGEIGRHDGRAVRHALGALAADGLLERHPLDRDLARLPLA